VNAYRELNRNSERVAMRPHPYFIPAVLTFIEEAGSWRTGEQAGQLLVQHGPFLDIDNLQTA
jgi:hypothetical protein